MNEAQRFQELYAASGEDGGLIFTGALLQRAAKKFPEKIALICGEEKINFADLYKRASAISYLLQKAGVQPRDRVFLLFENSIEFYVAYCGAWQLGAVVAPLNTFLHEKELHHIVQDAQPKAMIVQSNLAQPFTSLVPLIFTEKDMMAAAAVPQDQAAFPPYRLDDNELAVLLYTSGTTGFPKGVMLSSKNIITNLIQGLSRLQIDMNQRIIGILPLFHSFAQCACVWGPLFAGATTIVVPKITRQEILKALKHEPTIFLGVPALYGLICLLKTAPLDSVNYFLCGGDALPDKIRQAFELVYGRKLCNGYGLTEASPIVSGVTEDILLPANCIGKPVIGLEVAIRDEQGNEVPQGSTGTLWVKGDNVMLGYYRAPEQTQKVIVNGWLNTGDLASLDKQGRIYIQGREKDLIIHKGFNIYPQEIENVIMTHPSVIMVGVVGKKDDEGEVPVAFVAPREGDIIDEAVLKAFCANHLAAYKIPRQFIVLEKLPTTATGKVDKKKLKADYLEK